MKEYSTPFVSLAGSAPHTIQGTTGDIQDTLGQVVRGLLPSNIEEE